MSGTYIQANHTTVQADVTSLQVLTRNETRRYALFANDSDSTVYLSLGTAAVAGAGIPIRSGTSYEMSCSLGNLYKGDVYVTAAAGATGTKPLLVTVGV